MCGINGILHLKKKQLILLKKKLTVMNTIQKHRGPDYNNVWINNNCSLGLGHTRLSIIDLNNRSNQPMTNNHLTITFNGEIYNYKKLKDCLNDEIFNTNSDTEVILSYYNNYNKKALEYLNGMFSFAIWNDKTETLFCARDRIGIKPFYYLIQNDVFYFSSEAKTLIPFLNNIEEDLEGVAEYLTFQYSISERTMIKGIKELQPGHYIEIKNGIIKIEKYWDLDYTHKIDTNEEEHINNIRKLIDDSLKIHLVSDVPITSYISGGIDSSIISCMAINKISELFHGKFNESTDFDESIYAEEISKHLNINMNVANITSNDFKENIKKIIYHLDFPMAGPGSFPQYIVSKLVSEKYKVVLGGQGGDEIFAGYVRYLIPYFEKTIEEALDNKCENLKNLLPHLGIIKNYKPLLEKFFKDGMFKSLENRFFKIIDRSSELENIINWDILNKKVVYEKFKIRFNNKNIPSDDFFNKMLDFDLKYALPSLLHVEDRMSMAVSIESRVPFINHKIIEYMAKVPENIKINSGNMKYLLKKAKGDILPDKILYRKDKMGFPVPLNIWFENELKDFFIKNMVNLKKRNISYLKIDDKFLNNITEANKFSRKNWVLLSLELWYQNTFDKFIELQNLIV